MINATDTTKTKNTPRAKKLSKRVKKVYLDLQVSIHDRSGVITVKRAKVNASGFIAAKTVTAMYTHWNTEKFTKFEKFCIESLAD